MIDFNKSLIFKLQPDATGNIAALVSDLLIDGESVIVSFVTIRDGIAFTNKRIIAVNVQGLTGQKKDFTSIPYSRIQTFSVETAGKIDLDGELDIWISSVGKVRFEFGFKFDVMKLGRLLSKAVLK